MEYISPGRGQIILTIQNPEPLWIGHTLYPNIDPDDLQTLQGSPLFERNLDGIIPLAARLDLRRHDSGEPYRHPPGHKSTSSFTSTSWIPCSIHKLIRPVVQPFLNSPCQNRNRPRTPELLIRSGYPTSPPSYAKPVSPTKHPPS